MIQEALSAGCPCIISDQTPWKELEERDVGALNDMQCFTSAVDSYAAMDEKTFDSCAKAAHQYAIDNSNQKVKSTGYRKIFDIKTEQ